MPTPMAGFILEKSPQKDYAALPLYAPLRNKGFFDTAKADRMCVYWNEDVDLCPDMVYTDSRPA